MMVSRREVITIISSLATSGMLANNFTTNNTKQTVQKNKLPGGVFTAALTPLNGDLNADHKKLVSHINWLLKRGNDGIGLLGTTGEANSFGIDERKKILEAVLDGGIPAGKLLVGTGCCSVTDTVILTRHAHQHGAGGVLILPPFYYKKISDTGLENYFDNFFQKIGENDLQVYLYHFPQLSGVPFTVKLIEKLVSKYPGNIVGMKDSGGDWSHMEEVMKAIPNFRFYTGSEKYLLPTLKAGGVGCISASTNLTSPEAAAVYNAWKKGAGETEQGRLSSLREALETFPSIGTLKYVFAKLSANKDWLNIKPPNTILTTEEGLQIEQKLKELNYFKPF